MNNTLVRTLAGIVFGAIMVFGILLNGIALGALFLVIMLMAMKEFYTISAGSRFLGAKKLAYFTAALIFTVPFCRQRHVFSTRFSDMPRRLTRPALSIFDKYRKNFADISLIYAGLMYIALPVSLVPYLVFKDGFFSGKLLLSLFIIIWASDVGAYFLGTALGQKPDSRKLAPTISPKKSWWGFWGGIVLGVAAAVVLYFVTWIPYNFWHCIALGAIVSVGGVCGDLVESMWKRHYGVKDSGNCIPGHGGMLDRFDSSLFAIPLAAVYMVIFNLL